MCGLAGVFHLDHSAIESIPSSAMMQAMAHRGPDDEGHWCEGPLYLMHKRLSIIDLSEGGHQPMMSSCGRVVLIFNGEIYNYAELKKELEAIGYVFKSQSDSEVLAAALAQWREKAIDKLIGMFAFAAWFVEDKKLLLARDRTGIKPLYYQTQGVQFSFASEIASLKPLWKTVPPLNMTALHHYLSFGHGTDTSSLLEGVNKLPAAHYMWVGSTPQRYWQPDFTQRPISRDIEMEILHTMKSSVKHCLISDRPTALMLSGGVDSSIIAALAAEQGTKLNAYTVYYPFLEGQEEFNEIPYADTVADKYGITLNKMVVSERDVMNNFEKALHQMDEPNACPAYLPLYCSYQKIKEQTTVVLDGAGADEIFAGYRKYLVAHSWEHWENWPMIWRQLMSKMGLFGSSGPKWFDLNERERIIAPQLMYSGTQLKKLMVNGHDPQWHDTTVAPYALEDHLPLSLKMQWFDLNNHVTGWGNAVLDSVSMRQGMECRVPYQDHRLIELLMGLNANSLIKWPQEKALQKKIFSYLLPPEVTKRRKQGFGFPIKHFLRGGMKDFMNDTLSETALRKQGLFDSVMIQDMINEQNAVITNHSQRLWPLVVLTVWYENLKNL